MLNENLTKQQAEWLINEFAPRMGGIVNGKTMGTYFLPARELMTGKPSEAPACGCHYLSYAKMTASMYSQYQGGIKEVASQIDTKVIKRGRKKKEL